MKKIFVFIIFMLLMPTIVFAKENVLTINLYEYDKITEFPDTANLALACAQEKNLIESSVTNHDNYYNYSLVDKGTGKKFYEENCPYNSECTREEFLLDSFTEDDSIEFSPCTNSNSSSNELIIFDYSHLDGYSNIVINYSNKKNDKKGVYIAKIHLIDKSIGTNINEIKNEDLRLSFDTTYSELNDYAKYKVIIRNNSDNDYQINVSEKYGKNNIIKYEFSFEDNNNVLSANSKKALFVKSTYTSEVPTNLLINNVYKDTNSLDIVLKNDSNIVNPKTNTFTLLVVLITSIILISIIIMIKVPRLRKKMTFILVLTVLIPGTVKALEMISINVTDKVEINKNPVFCINNSTISYYGIPSNHDIPDSGCYRFAEGMTWEEWFASDFNTKQMNYVNALDVVAISSSTAYCDRYFGILNAFAIVDANNNLVNLTDEIQKKANYHGVWKNWRHNYDTDTYEYRGNGFSVC